MIPAGWRIILSTLKELAEKHCIPFVMPLHPRTINSLKSRLKPLFDELKCCGYIRIIPPVSYLEMTLLEKTAG